MFHSQRGSSMEYTMFSMKFVLLLLSLSFSMVPCHSAIELPVESGTILVTHRVEEKNAGEVLLVFKYTNNSQREVFVRKPNPENNFDMSVSYRLASDLPSSEAPRDWTGVHTEKASGDLAIGGYPVARSELVSLKSGDVLEIEHPVSKYFGAIRAVSRRSDVYITWLARLEVFSSAANQNDPLVRRHTGGFYIVRKLTEQTPSD